MYLLIARSCSDCGGDIQTLLVENEPTPEQIREVQDGMGICVKLYIVKDVKIGKMRYTEMENK